MKVLAIIPARSGSKGFPNKNIATIKGKTLIEWAVQTAIKSHLIDDVYISTDSSEYESIAVRAGAKSIGLRPESLSGDRVKTAEVIEYLLSNIEQKYDYVVLLQPTSPIRYADDVDTMLEQISTASADSIVAVEKIDEPHPNKLKKIENGHLVPYIPGTSSEVPRQLLPDVYKLSGSIYVVKCEFFLQHKSFFSETTLPYVVDYPSVNIDSELDYLYLMFLIEKGKVTLDE